MDRDKKLSVSLCVSCAASLVLHPTLNVVIQIQAPLLQYQLESSLFLPKDAQITDQAIDGLHYRNPLLPTAGRVGTLEKC
jgi:hypothetical protein